MAPTLPNHRPGMREFASRFKQSMKLCAPGFYLRVLVGAGASIASFTHPRERLAIYDEARTACKTGQFLEVGSHLGASAVVLAEVLRRSALTAGRVYCIDTWRNDAMSEGTVDTWQSFERHTANWTNWIVPLRGLSTEVELPAVGQFDLVFIDGDHSYEGAHADAQRFAPMVRLGGRLLMHDHDRPAVARVVGELLNTGRWNVTRCVGHIIALQRLG